MIKEFKGSTKWLSNFELVDIEYKGINYPSTEHAYMSAKNDDKEWKEFCSDKNISCAAVKKAGNVVSLRKDWEDIKLQVMEEILIIKFTKEPYRTMLLDTGVQNLQEGNHWQDRFWGISFYDVPNEGENHLGRIIMKIRDKLKEGIL